MKTNIIVTFFTAIALPSLAHAQVTLDGNGNIIRSPEAMEHAFSNTVGPIRIDPNRETEDTEGKFWAVAYREVGEGWAAATGNTKRKARENATAACEEVIIGHSRRTPCNLTKVFNIDDDNAYFEFLRAWDGAQAHVFGGSVPGRAKERCENIANLPGSSLQSWQCNPAGIYKESFRSYQFR